MPQTWDWKMLRMQSAQAWIFDPYCCWLSSKHQFVHKKKAPYALPVSHHDGGEAPLYRPTQGWTVDEACLLCKVIYILWPSSLGLDGEYILHPSPRRPNIACTWDICFPLANIKHSTQTFFAFLFYPNPQDCSKHKKRMVTYHDSATSNYAKFITSALKSPTKSTTTQQEIPQQ